MKLFVFGLGYTASRIAAAFEARGWQVAGTGGGRIAFDDVDQVARELGGATQILSSVPPAQGGDPVLDRYGHLLGAPLGYLSSTGVYGDAGGAWVDESAPLNGRRADRTAADRAWLERGARVYRLPGIYGPGRSALDRVAAGQAHRIDDPGQVFSRIHVEDIVAAVLAGIEAPAGAYNIADDLPASQNAVAEAAAEMLGLPPPPFVALETLSPMARSFYAENRRVANLKAKRVLGWRPRYPEFRAGLRALRATSSPASATIPPPIASGVQA